jgi:predicted ribosomally synthesized peptide with nif11-like leader
MSKQALNEFRAKLAADDTLRNEMTRALSAGGTKTTASVDDLVAFAKSHGYEFTNEEAREKIALSDQELDHVAGGAVTDRSLKMQDLNFIKVESFSLNFSKVEIEY